MIDITPEKQRLLSLYAKKYCKIDNPANCNKSRCECALLAEYHAFKNMIIPEGYRKFTVKDFTGELGSGLFLDNVVAATAKKQVIDYCYGSVPVDFIRKMSINSIDTIPILRRRLENGNNIVIHGDATRQIVAANSGDNIVSEKPLGRTFIASIITKEALKLKIDKDHYKKHFDWVDFSNLTRVLKSNEDSDRYEAQYYQECDWLVIDDITENTLASSPAQKAWTGQMYDAFFSNRYRDRLITVLIFRFDVNRRRSEVESAFGVSITKIIDDKKTYVIGLTDKRGMNVERD